MGSTCAVNQTEQTAAHMSAPSLLHPTATGHCQLPPLFTCNRHAHGAHHAAEGDQHQAVGGRVLGACGGRRGRELKQGAMPCTSARPRKVKKLSSNSEPLPTNCAEFARTRPEAGQVVKGEEVPDGGQHTQQHCKRGDKVGAAGVVGVVLIGAGR